MAAVVVRVRLGLEKVPHSVSPCLLLLKRGTPEKLDLGMRAGKGLGSPGRDSERESVAPGTRGPERQVASGDNLQQTRADSVVFFSEVTQTP